MAITGIGLGGRVGELGGRLKAAFSDAAAEIAQVQVAGELTVAGVIWRATQTGLLLTAAGVESPSYKRIQVWDLIAMGWQDGKFVIERHQSGSCR